MSKLDQPTTRREQIQRTVLKAISAARREVAAAFDGKDYEAAGDALTERVSEVRKALRQLSE